MTELQLKLAEDAVIEAIEALVARGQRPYLHNVPIEAQRIMIFKGRGTITEANASDSIKRAIVTLNNSGKIEAHMEPRKTWRIVDIHVLNLIQPPGTDTGEKTTSATLAEGAVLAAIENLVANGERPYSHNVPREAQRIMISEGRGRITEVVASDAVTDAISSLHDNGKIEAHIEPRKTWRIVDSTT